MKTEKRNWWTEMATITKTEQPTETKKVLYVEVPREKVHEKVDEIFQKLQEETAIPGFRKGKAPLELVKLRFTKAVKEQSIQDVVNDALKEVLEEQEIRFVTTPKVDNIQSEPGEDGQSPVKFTVEVEYIPKYDLVHPDKIYVEKARYEPTEAEVAQYLENIRERMATHEPITDRPSQAGDYVVVNVKATIDGEPFKEASADSCAVALGEGGHLPGMEEALTGVNPEQNLEIDLEIPGDFHLEDRRGKTCHLEMKVEAIRKRILPELNDEFAKEVGDFENLAALKDQIRDDMQVNAEGRVQEQNRLKLTDKLLEIHPFVAPASMVQARFEYLVSSQESQMRSWGATDAFLDENRERLLGTNKERAESQTRLSIILSDFSEKENITLSDEEFDLHLAFMARQRRHDPEQFAHHVFRRGLDEYYKRMFLEDKVVDYLLNKVHFLNPGEQPPADTGEDETTVEPPTAEDVEQPAPYTVPLPGGEVLPPPSQEAVEQPQAEESKEE